MNVQTFLKRYKYFFILLVLNLLLVLFVPELGKQSLTVSFDSFLEMLTILPPVFILMGLMDVWVPKEVMMKYMGKEARMKGGMIAFLLGSLSAGPLYASFPVAAMFLKKGVSLTNVYIFLGAWSTTKVPLMMFEITQLGIPFALLRFVLNCIGMIVIAFLIDKTTDAEGFDRIRESACRQIEE